MAHHRRHQQQQQPDTKSVDVGSMFLIDLSVEESCSDLETEAHELDELEVARQQQQQLFTVEDDFREHHQQLQKQQQPELMGQQAAKYSSSSASKTIATSRNSKQMMIFEEEENDDECSSSSLSSSTADVDVVVVPSSAASTASPPLNIAKSTTDKQMPPSSSSTKRANTVANAVSYLSDHDFLEQEYNDNHHNHYSTDESDGEPLSAEDNPMKLFESIQALARSLHEDAELFGSLPPKRTLESPIRSLLLT